MKHVNGWLEVKMVFMKQVGKWPKSEYREDMLLLQEHFLTLVKIVFQFFAVASIYIYIYIYIYI
jgi:hypothetical protein